LAGVLEKLDEHSADEHPPVDMQNEEHNEEGVLEVILVELFSPSEVKVLRYLNAAMTRPS
jgi:hypothetical protein